MSDKSTVFPPSLGIGPDSGSASTSEENNNGFCQNNSVPSSESQLTVMVDEDSARVELQKRIVTVVESLFSNENLAKDEFLLGHLRRHKGGFVSLRLVAACRRVRAVSKDLPLIQGALQGLSHKLRLNVEATKIRRLEPLPPALEKGVKKENGEKNQQNTVCKVNNVAISESSVATPAEKEDKLLTPSLPKEGDGGEAASSPPNMSKWLQKRLEAKSKTPSVQPGTPMMSTVIRLPKGPPSDGSTGFAVGYRAQLLRDNLEEEEDLQ